jgi:uncharacterized protein YbbK (DUF523 family)
LGDDFIYLVSSCLAGFKCRYNGLSIENAVVADLVKQGQAIAVCPEILGGLCTPRQSCEISSNSDGKRKVVSLTGEDFTREFLIGARRTLKIAKTNDIKKAILKARSPSCGYGQIYDGTFSGKLIMGNGFTAELLIENKIEVFTENDLKIIFN